MLGGIEDRLDTPSFDGDFDAIMGPRFIVTKSETEQFFKRCRQPRAVASVHALAACKIRRTPTDFLDRIARSLDMQNLGPSVDGRMVSFFGVRLAFTNRQLG